MGLSGLRCLSVRRNYFLRTNPRIADLARSQRKNGRSNKGIKKPSLLFSFQNVRLDSPMNIVWFSFYKLSKSETKQTTENSLFSVLYLK
jgi:hypothetical protein